MKTKTFSVAFILLMCSVFISCDPSSKAKTGCWKLVATEIWWVPPTDGNPPLVQISEVPVGQTFTRSDGWEAIYSGAEHNLTRTDKLNGSLIGSITFTWTPFPEYIDPGVEFNCNIESKGNSGNGIGVILEGSGPWVQSFRNGMKTAKLTIPKPIDVTVADQRRFWLDLSSGGYSYIYYYYIYAWIPE
jgi:hypothetical protein